MLGASALILVVAAACEEPSRSELPLAPSFSGSDYCTLSPEECQEIYDRLQGMSQQGYCNDLRNQGLDTYYSTTYGYQPGTAWGCGTAGDIAGYVIEYFQTDGGTEVGDNVYICDAAFGSNNNVGSTLAHEAHHQVSGDVNNHTEGDQWGSQCAGQ
jgi:hypothetical protein